MNYPNGAQQPPHQGYQQPYQPQGQGYPTQPYYPPQMMYQPQMNVNVNIGKPHQVNMILRIIYFFCIGFWLGMLWLSIALGFMASFIGLPIGLLMINRLGSVMTLSRR